MKVLLFLGLCLLSAATSMAAQVCQTPAAATVGPNDPRLPKALPPSFQVTIEGAIIDKNYSVVAEEYFDLDLKRSAMKITQNGQIEYIYINMNTNESYHIANNNCTVHNQALDEDDAFIGGRMSSSKMTHTYSTSSVLKFAQKYGEVYKGSTTIRGIPCDHWQSCMYWSSIDANFTLDYYFSATSWQSADGSVQIPVRAEVQGYQNMIGPSSSFHHIYDYIGFKSYIVDPTNLETIKGVACPGRKHTRAMPKLKQHYQYREEIVDMDLDEVVNADVWYDYNYKLLRFDTRPIALAYPYYSYDAVTEIHDYNTGVAYIIDKSFLNCSIVPIENGTWDATMNVSRSHQALGMKSPEQLFDLTPSFAYSGQRYVRGILCDVFTNVRTDFGGDGLLGTPVTFEVYFMSNDWTSDNDVGNNQDSVDTPVRLEMSSTAVDYSLSYDFYNFDQENPVLRRFDISKCYTDRNKITFEITFPGNYKDFLLNYQTILEELSVVILAKTGGLSPIRIQGLSVHWDTKNAYLVGTILDVAPNLARYRRWPNLVANFKDDATQQNVGDAISCSALCENQQVTCNSFDVCPTLKTCALSLNYTSDGKVLQSSSTCDHYSRVLTGAVDHETPLVMAYNLIAKAVTGGTFVVPVQLPSVGINQQFTAASIRQLSYSATTPGATQNQNPGQQTSNPGQQTSKPNPGQQTPKPNPGQQTPKPNPGQQTSKPNPGQQTPKPNPGQKTPKQGTGNNPTKAPVKCGEVGSPQKSSSNAGAMAGVALAMLAVGVIIGVGVMIFLQRRQKTAENLQVAFVNKNFED